MISFTPTTIAQVQSTIMNAINSGTSGINITSTSQTELLLLISEIAGIIINYEENQWATLVTEVNNSEFQLLTAQHYQQLMLEFHANNFLDFNNQTFNWFYVYPSMGANTITKCSVTVGEQVIFKIAGGSNGNSAVPSIYNADIQSYAELFTGVGTKVIIINQGPDFLYLQATITYDGIYSTSGIYNNVYTSISNFLSDLEFDGILYLSQLVRAIRNTPGVLDIDLSTINAIGRGSLQTFYTTLPSIDRLYVSQGGTIILENTPGYQLIDTLTFVLQ